MADSTGGKSTLVQAPQVKRGPTQKGTKGRGFINGQKKGNADTVADHDFFPTLAPKDHSSNHGPADPYPTLSRNDLCGCKSGKKYKKCCKG